MAGGFDSLGLMPELLRAVDDMSWLLPTDVQDEAIPLILGGGDVMAASETGSGKTAAFCLPILQCVYEQLRQKTLSEKSNTPSSSDTATATTAASSSGGGDTTTLSTKHNIKLNLSDKDVVLKISSDELECVSSADKLWVGARATHGVKNGLYAYECMIQGDPNGICRVGWSSISSKLDLGRDINGFGYGGTAMKSNNGKFEAYGQKYSVGDVITCFVNFSIRKISYAKNGVLLDDAFDIPNTMNGIALFPAIAVKGSAARFHFDKNQFKYPNLLVNGYQAIADALESDITSFAFRQDVSSMLPTSSSSSSVLVGKRSPIAVIIEPARDLAEQVYDTIINLSKYIENPDIKTMLLVGGDDYRKQRQEINEGADILVGTTGKIMDVIKSKTLSFSKIKFFVLDEADRLIETDNLDNIMFLYNACHLDGKGDGRLQVCFFSATLHSPAITDLSNKICFQPTWVDLKGIDSVPDTVHHVVYRIDPTKDMTIILNQYATMKTFTDNMHVGPLSKEEENSLKIKQLKQQVLLNIIDKFQMSQVMIFCRTNVDCDNLEDFLNTSSGAGMRSLQERRQSLDAFRDGYVRILICTDVAARGIDIKGLPYVINMTLPDIAENYIHRIGRVGRADCMGLAISIVAANEYKEKVWYHTDCTTKGKGCVNRKLTDQGGCAIWYPEAIYLTAIETRLHMTIPELSIDFNLPPEIAEKQVEYGEESSKVGNQKESASTIHLNTLAPTVKELAELELLAQNSFLYMQSWKQG